MCTTAGSGAQLEKTAHSQGRRKAAARSLEASINEEPVAPSPASLKPLTLATATSRQRTHPMRTTMRLCPLWTRLGNSSQRKSGDPISSHKPACCEPNVDEAIFNSDIETWPISNGNSMADHMKAPVTLVNTCAAFEDEEDCIVESTSSDNFQDADIARSSTRENSRQRLKKDNQMFRTSLLNSKISEGAR